MDVPYYQPFKGGVWQAGLCRSTRNPRTEHVPIEKQEYGTLNSTSSDSCSALARLAQRALSLESLSKPVEPSSTSKRGSAICKLPGSLSELVEQASRWSKRVLHDTMRRSPLRFGWRMFVYDSGENRKKVRSICGSDFPPGRLADGK